MQDLCRGLISMCDRALFYYVRGFLGLFGVVYRALVSFLWLVFFCARYTADSEGVRSAYTYIYTYIYS